MSIQQTLVECDHCGCADFTVYQSDDGQTIYVECQACGASVVTARAEP